MVSVLRARSIRTRAAGSNHAPTNEKSNQKMKIKKWGRFFAVFDENDALVCVTVYKKRCRSAAAGSDGERSAALGK
jgi:hypothetical protein